jgi:hypothetical protein
MPHATGSMPCARWLRYIFRKHHPAPNQLSFRKTLSHLPHACLLWRQSDRPYAPCSLLHAPCPMLHSPCYRLHATGSLPCARWLRYIFRKHHHAPNQLSFRKTLSHLPHAPCSMLLAPCTMPHAPCPMLYRPEICLQFFGLILHFRFILDSMGKDELELCWAKTEWGSIPHPF